MKLHGSDTLKHLVIPVEQHADTQVKVSPDNPSSSLRPPWDQHDQTGKETAISCENDPLLRITPMETSCLFMTYQGCPPAPAPPPPQTDKVKHEGQMLPNIDLSKHSPSLCFSDVTALLIHHDVLEI